MVHCRNDNTGGPLNNSIEPSVPFIWPEPRVSAGMAPYASLPFDEVARSPATARPAFVKDEDGELGLSDQLTPRVALPKLIPGNDAPPVSLGQCFHSSRVGRVVGKRSCSAITSWTHTDFFAESTLIALAK